MLKSRNTSVALNKEIFLYLKKPSRAKTFLKSLFLIAKLAKFIQKLRNPNINGDRKRLDPSQYCQKQSRKLSKFHQLSSKIKKKKYMPFLEFY